MYVLEQIWDTVLEMASWMLDGTWYMVVIKICGAVGVVFMLRAFIFGIENWFETEVPMAIKGPLLSLALLALVLLIVGLVWVAVTE
jgi:hypothetical protein